MSFVIYQSIIFRLLRDPFKLISTLSIWETLLLRQNCSHPVLPTLQLPKPTLHTFWRCHLESHIATAIANFPSSSVTYFLPNQMFTTLILGLYHLPNHSWICTTKDYPHIVHGQLGHPSLEMLQKYGVKSLQVDMKNIFLHGDLNEIFYMELHLGSVAQVSHQG